MDKKNKNSNSDEEKNSKLPVVRKASEFDISFTSNPNLNEKENTRIHNAVKNEGIAVGSTTYVSSKGVQVLLKTDKKGTAKVFNEAPQNDLKSFGDQDYLSTPQTQKEIAKRKEQPRSQLEREYLDASAKALNAFSTNAQLEKERTIQSDRNIEARSTIGKKVIKTRNLEVSDVTGDKLDNSTDGKPVVHHKERAADSPEKFLDEKNLVVMRNDEHIEFHADPELLPTEEGLKEYAKKKRNTQ